MPPKPLILGADGREAPSTWKPDPPQPRQFTPMGKLLNVQIVLAPR